MNQELCGQGPINCLQVILVELKFKNQWLILIGYCVAFIFLSLSVK